MKPEDVTRLRHMRDAASEALRYCQDMNRQDFLRDTRTQRAVTCCIQIIGEAAYHVSDETRSLFPGVPWRKITGTRHRLVHAYFDIDLGILWTVVQDELEPLIKALAELPPGGDGWGAEE